LVGYSAPVSQNIVELAGTTPDLSTLVIALETADLVNTLSGKGPFTVFAPTNEAFAALPAGVLANLLKPENKAQLVDILTYHVAAGNVQSKDLTDMELIKTVEGQDVQARVSSSKILINSAKVTAPDNEASNGVVHIIDAVLMPAPAPTPGEKNIVALAEATPDLSQLVTELQRWPSAGLVGTLSGKGPFTVFAPNNNAWQQLFSKQPGINYPANQQKLIDVLDLHVVSSAVLSSDLKNGQKIKTVSGAELTVNIVHGEKGEKTIYISGGGHDAGSRILTADIKASNGLVHIVTGVLLPPTSWAASSYSPGRS